MIRCRVCGKQLRLVSWQHVRIHGMTTAEYREKFPDAPRTSKKARRRYAASARKTRNMRGKNHSPEARRKMSRSHSGKTLSEAHREAIGRGNRRNYRKHPERREQRAVFGCFSSEKEKASGYKTGHVYSEKAGQEVF